jgi:hypothetical protein
MSHLCALALSGAFIPATYAAQIPSSFAREATVLRSSPDAASEAVADVPKKARLFLGPPTLMQKGWMYVLYDNGTEIKGGYLPLNSAGGVSESTVDQASVVTRIKSTGTALEQVRVDARALDMKCNHSNGNAGTGSCAFHYVLTPSAPKRFSGYVRARCSGTLVLSPNATAEGARSFPHTHDSNIPVGNGIGMAVELISIERSVAKEFPHLHPSSAMACTVVGVYQ